MFVRDGNSNPREIAKIFVRDAAGNPQEISKIYVRDAAGNPKLVFDNTVIITSDLCPTCGNTIFRIEPLSQATSNRARLTDEARTFSNGPYIPNTTTSIGSAFVPAYTVNKDYWSKVALSYDYTVATETTASTGSFEVFSGGTNLVSKYRLQFTQTQLFELSSPTAAEYALGSSWYWNKINSIFATNINYPILPGYIIVDWNTYTIRDTFLVVMKDPQRLFTSHCNAPNDPIGGSHLPPAGCPEFNIRESSIYPFYNRPILTKVSNFDSNDIYAASCGQNYCFDVFNTIWTSADSECFNQHLIHYQDPNGVIITGNCSGGIDGSGSGGTVLGNLGTETSCDSPTYINWNEGTSGLNPFSFIINKQNHGTRRTIPTVSADALVQDCCISNCYGPVPLKIATAANDVACRHVYQIPPINTINTNGTDRLGFFENIYTSILMGAESAIGTPIASAADVRIVLPCYVNLHPDFAHSIVKVFPTQYDVFVNGGLGPTGTAANVARDKTVWEAVKSFMPYIPGTATITPTPRRSWLSSVHFHYNEDRPNTDVAPFQHTVVPSGTTVSTNGFPALLWNISGYPTEQSTHYVVLELHFDATQVCVANAFNILQLKTPENQKFFILGMRFYPVSRNGQKHPIFRDHIIPTNVQAFANTNGGFVDYYAGVSNQNALTTDQEGVNNPGVWYTTNSIQTTAFADGTISGGTTAVVFTIPNCTGGLCTGNYGIKYPPIGTMQKFLDKYYQLPINT